MIVPVNRSRTALTALSMISVLALGACSGDDPEPKVADPSPSATLPSSPSTTPVSGPVEPTMPAAARGSDAAAAEAFVKFYWEMVNYAQATGDVEGLKVLATRCLNCDTGVHSIEAAYEDGGEIRGGTGTVDRFDTKFIDRGRKMWAIVECRLSLTPQVVDMPGSGKDQRYPGGPSEIRMYLQPSADAWTVRSVGKR